MFATYRYVLSKHMYEVQIRDPPVTRLSMLLIRVCLSYTLIRTDIQTTMSSWVWELNILVYLFIEEGWTPIEASLILYERH